MGTRERVVPTWSVLLQMVGETSFERVAHVADVTREGLRSRWRLGFPSLVVPATPLGRGDPGDAMFRGEVSAQDVGAGEEHGAVGAREGEVRAGPVVLEVFREVVVDEEARLANVALDGALGADFEFVKATDVILQVGVRREKAGGAGRVWKIAKEITNICK